MSQCHHHVFNALQRKINCSIPFEVLRPILLERGVIPPSLDKQCTINNGIRLVVGYLRNQDFDTFLKFVECICVASNASARVEKNILGSISSVVQDFDSRNSTQHHVQVEQIIKQFQKKAAFVIDVAHDITNFSSEGGIYENIEYGLKIVVPCDAVGEGETLEMKISPQFQGPFSVSDKYLLITPYYLIIPSLPLRKPINIFMEHCLEMPVYQKSREVVVLRASHDIVSGSGLHYFEPILNPDISDTLPVLSFHIQNLCYLCAALDKSACTEIPESVTTRKQYRVVYTLLLYEPEDDRVKQNAFSVLIYACQSCSVVIKECKCQAEKRLGYKVKFTPITDLGFDSYQFEFKPDNEHIQPKTQAVIKEIDIQLHWKPAAAEGCKAADVKGLAEQMCYPPSVEFYISSNAPEVNTITIVGSDEKRFFKIFVPARKECNQGLHQPTVPPAISDKSAEPRNLSDGLQLHPKENHHCNVHPAGQNSIQQACGLPIPPVCSLEGFGATSTMLDTEAVPPVPTALSKSVFLLYCKEEGGPSKEDILSLSYFLGQCGVSCTCDMHCETNPPDNWNLWTENQIKKSDHTLLICFPLMFSVCTQMPKHSVVNMHCGCFFDSSIVNYVHSKKFIPIFLNQPTNMDLVPFTLRAASHYELPLNQLTQEMASSSKSLEDILMGGQYQEVASLLSRLHNNNPYPCPMLQQIGTTGNGTSSSRDGLSLNWTGPLPRSSSVPDTPQSSNGTKDHGPNVTLGEDDLVDVMEEIWGVAKDWKPLGQALRLRAADLDTIASKHPNNIHECLRDTLLAWLLQRYDVQRFGSPSWSFLIKAIEYRAGANNPALAKRLTIKHRPCVSLDEGTDHGTT